MRKSGVSLITVLLFMLVATIAATATYKWITSEGRSSASRMMEREAYQSSIAGIDNARTWMTFHANDVGALIRQYLSSTNKLPDGTRKAINLDGRLRSLQRNGQQFHVWLAGVNVENSTYKLKIISQGLARRDTVNSIEVAAAYHNEIAILNVDGLYQVTIPQVQHHSNIDFNFAYYGGSYTSAGKVVMTSGVVNGNWSGNPPEVENNWIVTGNITLSGNDLKVGQTACIGGNASIQNNGITTTDFYVGGNFDGLIKKAFGSVYFNGDAKHSGTGSMIIDGNMTVNGFYQTAQDASDRATRIGGNLCVSDSGAIVSKATTDPFIVNGNVWMPGPRNLWYGSIENYGSGRRLVHTDDNQGSYNKILLGDSSSQAFIASAISLSSFKSSLKNKTITEIAGYRKDCSSRKSTGDQWRIKKYGFGSGINIMSADNKDICGTWKDSYSDIEFHNNWGYSPGTWYIEFLNNGWQTWDASTYKPYDQYTINDGDNKYAMYYSGGVTDVEFRQYNNSDWRDWVATGYNEEWMQTDYVRDYNEGELFYGSPTYDVWKLNDGQVSQKFKAPTSLGAYFVGGNVFYDLKNYNGYNYDMSASKATGSPYCKKKQGDTYRPDCRVTPWFRADGTVSNSMPNEREFACAESVLEDCDNIWDESSEGCDGSKYLVDDPLITDSSAYMPYAQKGCAASITTWPQSGFEKTLNDCYKENAEDDTKREQNLYNGYLVVHITGGSPGQNYNPDASTPLKGKFVIIVDNRLQAGQNGLPKTTADTKVFLFLREGANYVQQTVEHYFIYTKKNIGESGQLNLTGTLYAPARACATTRFQSSTLTFDQPLVQDLTDAGIICQNDGSGGCSGASASTSTSTGHDNLEVIDGGKDSYYISMAPQLGVTVETQYASNENLVKAADGSIPTLEPSFIVLPRIVYLPRDPYGKLSDYYSIVQLNGSNLAANQFNINCQAGLPATGDLYNEAAGVLLDQKVYRCDVGGGNAIVPFWVVVNGTLGSAPQVSFVETVQEMSPHGSAEVHANIPAHATSITVLVACPSSKPTGWNYVMNESYSPHINNGVCSFTFPQGADGQLKLFDVYTEDVSNGTLFFQLLAGEGYAVTWPFLSELHVANLATINRVDPSDEEIDKYCEAMPDDCPAVGHRSASEWPDCPIDSIWVEPSVFSAIEDTNNSWTVPTGGSGTLTLEDKPISGCVVIIPMENNSLDRSTIEADSSYTLKAIAKARKSSVKVGFTGNVGTGKNPYITIDGNSRSITCNYDDVKDSVPKACTMDLYNGETVKISILRNAGDNENFNYWKCENNGGNTCPTTDPITSSNYMNFVIKDNKAVILAHFGEVDKHCFFDEFKQGGVECRSGNTKYCIDNCGNSPDDVCVGVVDANGTFTNSKWHLVEGSMDNIEDSYESISIDNAASRGSNRSSREAVKVMSTVEAGLRGTLKALVQLPKATSSFGKTAANIAKSGFLLHSNATGTEFLMLNVFVNTSGKLETNLCTKGGTEGCISSTPKNNGNTMSVSPSSMVMVEALLTDSNTLELTVFSGNYYGTPDAYTSSLKLDELPNNYNSRDHEYVGFSMADPNFKIYGIGWSSDDYGADKCWDTYPTVKCSFSAVASDGVIPTETTVEPWLGHSGWFDSKHCTPVYYYKNGTDACNGHENSETSCPSTGYYFSQDGAGQHGYRDNNGVVDVKAATAWLDCIDSDDQTVAWSASTENHRAHCGMFWTGKFTECTRHADIGTLSVISAGGTESTITLTTTVNLRASKLNISLENPNNSQMEVWLLSENDTWGADDFASQSVRFTGSTASFDVVETFAEGAQGFDPENVKQVVIKNLGDDAVSNVSVSSSCKNAVGISNCQVAYNEQNSRWEISADVSNKTKVASYAVTGQVNSSDVVTSTSEPSLWTSDRATWNIDHNPYESYQGSTFNFTASAINASGETFSTACTPAVTIGSISCSNATSSNIASGAAWPAFNFKLNNCPQNSCNYEIWFDGSPLSGNSACTDGSCSGSGGGNQALSKTKSGNAEECTTDGGCSHTYEVHSSDDDKPFTPCNVSFVVQKKVSTEVTATCSVSGSLYQGQKLELNVSNITNISGNVDMIWSMDNSTKTINCDATHCWNNKMNAPTATGTYSYTLTYKGNTVCTGSVDIGPALTCSVSPTTLGRGDDYTFTANGNLHCWNCSFTDASGSVENNLEVQKNGTLTKTKTANNTGSKTLTLACNSCDNNISASCSAPLTINAAAPVFSCPTNQSETVGNTVSITPQGLVGCEDGCSYTISGTSVTGSGYTSGALPSFTGSSSAGSVSYTVSLTNSVNTTSHDCSITYVSVSSILTASCPATISTFPLKYFNWGITTSGNGSLADDETLVRNLYIDDTYISSKNCTKYDCQNMDGTNAPATPGTYTYSLKVGSEELCHGSLVVQNPIVCSAQPSGITSGNSITVKASWASGVEGQASDCSLSGSGVPSGGNCNYLWNFNSDISITPASTGTQNYTYSAKLSNNGNSAGPFECNWSVAVAAASSSSGGGGGTRTLSTTYQSYAAGEVWTLKTGTIGGGSGPNTFHCKVPDASKPTGGNEITIGMFSSPSCSVIIPSDNSESNGRGCTLESNRTYTFTVASGAPAGTTCGLKW